MPFVKFVQTGRSYSAKVSLSRTGMISFNDGSSKRYGMGEYKFANLYYDEDTKRIGIELTNDESGEGVRKLRHRTTGADIAAKNFIEFFNIQLKGTMIYDMERDEDTGFLTFDTTKGKERRVSKKPPKEIEQLELQ